MTDLSSFNILQLSYSIKNSGTIPASILQGYLLSD